MDEQNPVKTILQVLAGLGSASLESSIRELEKHSTASNVAVSLQSVLDVLADFDEFGGASLELVAWELDADESAVSAAWTQAIDDRLLEHAGSDHVLAEKMWRLSDRGKRARQDGVSG